MVSVISVFVYFQIQGPFQVLINARLSRCKFLFASLVLILVVLQTWPVWLKTSLLSWSDPSVGASSSGRLQRDMCRKDTRYLPLVAMQIYTRMFFGSPNKGPARTYLRTWSDAGRHINGQPYPERVNNCINMQPWYLEDFLRFLSWKRDAREQDVTRKMSKMALL